MAAESLIRKIVVWTLSILLALLFVVSGVPKLLGAEEAVKGFSDFGFPDWFRLLVGAIEFHGGILLLVPRLAWLGAIGLMAIMDGAVWTLLSHDATGQAIVPIVVFFLLGIFAYLRRPAWGRPGGTSAQL